MDNGAGGLPRNGGNFFANDTFLNFNNPHSHGGRLPRTFTERNGNFFDNDGFFEGGSPVHRSPFQDEPPFFRSSLPRHSAFPQERPIHVHRQQTTPQHRSPILERRDAFQPSPTPFHHQRSKSHYDDLNSPQPDWADSPFGHSQFRPFHPIDPAAASNIHRIPVRHSTVAEKPQNRGQFVEINNAQPNYSNGGLNPDKRRRFSNAQQQQNDHNYSSPRSPSIPNITIEDYGDGTKLMDQQMASPIPAVIPLPAPAIPLPPPEGMGTAQSSRIFVDPEEEMKKNEAKTEFEGIKKENGGKAELEEKVERSDLEIEEAKNMKYGAATFIPVAQSGDHLIRLLDETENQVEILRDAAAKLEQEKETILETIRNIKLTGGLLKLQQGDQDELELTANRILSRCQAVDVSVNTPRNEHQSRALQQVNAIIEGEMAQMQGNLANTKTRIRGFLNACMPEENGHIDDKFQSLIIDCTADDQKKIRRRLAQIIEQIERAQQFSPQASA